MERNNTLKISGIQAYNCLLVNVRRFENFKKRFILLFRNQQIFDAINDHYFEKADNRNKIDKFERIIQPIIKLNEIEN